MWEGLRLGTKRTSVQARNVLRFDVRMKRAGKGLIAACGSTKRVKSNTAVGLKTQNASKQSNTAPNEDAIIKLEDVSTIYEGETRTAIKNVNLTVKKKNP